MILKLNLKKDKTIELILYNSDQKTILDKIKWQEENNLGTTLLNKINQLLKNNQLKPSQIKKVKLNSAIDNQFTTTRIAQAITQAFSYSVRFVKSK